MPAEVVVAGSGVSSSLPSWETLASADSVLNCVRHKLEDFPLEDRITVDITDVAATSMIVNDPTIFAVGQDWEFDDGTNEWVRIRGPNPMANPVQITRGYRGTSGATHTAQAPLRNSPRFSRKQIQLTIENVLAGELSMPTCYSAQSFDITPSATQVLYDTPDDYERLIYATQKSTATNEDVHRLGARGFMGQVAWPVYEEFGNPSAVSANGMALRIPIFPNLTNTVRVWYAARTTTSTIRAGIMAECLCTGTALRLMREKTIPRSGQSDRGDQPNPIEVARSAGVLSSIFRDERNRLQAVLHRRWPLAQKRW